MLPYPTPCALWHHRRVFRFSASGLALAGLVSLLWPADLVSQRPLHTQKQSDPHLTQQAAGTLASLAPLQDAIRAQAAAVQGGDPAIIGTTSRALNAQIELLLAQFQLARGEVDQATALFHDSLRQQPSPERQLEFASALLHSHHSAAALTEANAVLATEPDNVGALLTRGSALRDTGDQQEAITTLTRALQLRPDPNVLFALGATYLSLHQKDKAEVSFQHLIQATSRNPFWYVAVGDAYRTAGYMDDAVQSFKTALTLDSKIPHGEFFLGLTYLEMNQWGPNPDSFAHLRRALELSPHDYFSNFYLGALESTEGSDLVASDRHLVAASTADPNQPEVWLYLGLNANREKRTANAKTYFQKAIKLTGNDEGRNNYQIRRAYFSLGRILEAEGDRTGGDALLARYKLAQQAAVAESNRSIMQTEEGSMAAAPLSSLAATTPSALAVEAAPVEGNQVQAAAEAKLTALLAGSLNDLGTAEARQHEYEAALADFQQSEHWDATNSTTLRNLGTAAFRVGNSTEAARALRLYQDRLKAKQVPMDQHAQLLLAMSEFSLGHFPEAAKDFSPIEQLSVQDPTTAYSYAFSLARTGHAQEANHVALTLSGQSLSRDLLPLVCHLFIDTEDYKDSQVCYRKALALEPTLALAHYEIGESLIHLDQPAEAIPELRAEMQQDAANPNVSTALAFALMQTSQKGEARDLLKRTVDAHPEHAEAQYEYGKLLLEDGQVKDSIAHLEASEHIDPSKDFVHYQLGTAYKRAGQTVEAEREFKAYRGIKDRNRDASAVPHQP